MKIEWNKKYTTIAVYAIIVIVLSALAIILLGKIPYFFTLLQKIIKILSPILYGFAFAYLLNFIMKFVETKLLKKMCDKKPRYKLRRILSISITYLITLLFLTVFFWIVLPQLVESLTALINSVPQWMEYAKNLINDRLPFVALSPEQINEAFSKISNIALDILPKTLDFVKSITMEVVNAVMGLIIAVYFLLSKEKFIAQMKKITAAILPQRHTDRVFRLASLTNHHFGGFLSGKIVDAMIVGVLCYLGMVVFRMQYALLISVIVGVFNVIPFFGPFIGAIPSAFILLMVDPMQSFWFIIFIIILQQIDGNLIGPRILGETTGLSAFWIIFAILLGGGLMGFIGMIIAVPAFAVIYFLIKYFVELRLEKKAKPVKTEEYTNKDEPIVF